MSEFWYTVYTMQDKYGEDYQSFSLFSPTHLFWLALCVCVCVGGFFLYRRASEKGLCFWRFVVAALILAVVCSRQVVIIVTGQWRPEVLPLHMCSINIFVCLWYTIHPTKLAGNILYTLCLPGAVIALLSPTWLALPVANVCHISSELLHILLALYPVLLLAGGFRPDYRMLPKVLLCLVGVCIIIYPLNNALGTNFFFLNDPYGNVISEVCTGIFGERFFIIGFALILAVLIFVLYLPWRIADRKRAVNEAGM